MSPRFMPSKSLGHSVLAPEAATGLGSFAIVGALTRRIDAEDWRFLNDWLTLRALQRDTDEGA